MLTLITVDLGWFPGFPGRNRRAGALILGSGGISYCSLSGTKEGLKISDARTGKMLYENSKTCFISPLIEPFSVSCRCSMVK
jgi:hypothetical protein